METKLSSFSKPSSSTHGEDLISDVPEFNCLACITTGLRSFYDGIRVGNSKTSLDGHTNSDGHFVPRLRMILGSRYHILSHITASGQSAVLLEAKDSFRKMMPVVIKVMHTSYFTVGMKEVQTLRRIISADPRELSHTVRLLNSFKFESHICLVFPLLNPLPLTAVIAKKCYSNDQMLAAFRKISLHLLSALAFLRRENIIHADVKPENILVHKDGDLEKGVTLIDFGNAIHHTHQEVSLYYEDFQLQTQPYRAPEVHLGNPFGFEVDMWSFGCVLLELFTGQLVFAGTDKADSLRKMMAVLGPLPNDMCKRGKFYPEVASLLSKVSSSQKVESGTLRLMSAFPCIRNYDFASFLSGLLTYHPDKRLTPWEALQHPFMAPEICIPYFLSDRPKDSGVIKKSDYSFRQTILPQILRLYPSTYDLLHAGTSDKPLIENPNVALVKPFDLNSIPEKDVASQQKYDNRSPIIQGKVSPDILLEMTTINRTKNCSSSPSTVTMMNGTDKCVSLPSEMTAAYRTDMCGSSSSEMTTCRTEKNVSSDWVTKNSVVSARLTKDTLKSVKHELPHQKNTVTQRFSQPSVSKQDTTLLISMDKKDNMNHTFNMYTNKSQNEELEIAQSQKVNPSCKSTSECKTGIQSLSLDNKSHNVKLTDPANRNRTAGESVLIHTASLLNANTQSCQIQESRFSKNDHCCEIPEGATSNACVKSEFVGTNICLKSECVGTSTCLKLECVGTSTCLKSECVGTSTCLKLGGAGTCACLELESSAKKNSTYRRHIILGTSAGISKEHSITKYIQHKSFSRSKYEGSQGSSQDVTQNVCLQSLPQENYLVSHNVCVPKASKHHSATRLSSYTHQVDSCPLGQIVEDTSTALQKHLIVKSCWQEPQVFKDAAVDKPVDEKVQVKNVVVCSTRNQTTNYFQASKNVDEINRQSYLPHQTSSNITLSIPGRSKDTKSWQLQLGKATIVKPDECIEKPGMTESDNHCKDNSKKNGQVVNLDGENAIDTCHHSLDIDQQGVITSSKNEREKDSSLSNTTYVFAHIEQKQPNISTVESDHPNEFNPGFPCKMYADEDINNCLHDAYTQEPKNLNELFHDAQHAHNKEQTGTNAQNLMGDFRTSPVIVTPKPVYNLRGSNTCVSTGNQTERPINVPGNCNKLTFLSNRQIENEDPPRKEPVMKPHNVIKSLQLSYSKTEEIKSKPKRQKLPRRAKSDCMYGKEAQHAINDPPPEGDIRKMQPQRRSLFQTAAPKGYTEMTHCSDNIDHRNVCQILEPGLSILELPSVEEKNYKMSENNEETNDAFHSRGLLKLNVEGRKAQKSQPSCKSQHNMSTTLLRAKEEEDCREDCNFSVSCDIERPLSLTRTRKRQHVQETDYNLADINFHKIKSRRELVFLTDCSSTEKDGKTSKLKTELLKPNVKAKSETAQEVLLLTQKTSETLQTDNPANHEIETTQFKAGMRNVSSILNTSGILKSRITRRSRAIHKAINPILKRNIKLCAPNKSINNLQAAPERCIGKQLSDASKLLRAKRVKKALSFNTKRSLQITNNGQFTITSKKSTERLSFPTPVLKNENGLTHCGKENDCFELLDIQSSGSNNKTNSKSTRLSLPVGDLNSSDPYEFKVTPLKLQQKINVNNLKQPKTACQRRSNSRSQSKTKRNRPIVAANSVACSVSSVSICDLVEQKSKYLFQDNNKIIPLAMMFHNNQQKCEERKEKHVPTSEGPININHCKMITKTELPSTGRNILVSKNRHVKMSPFQEHQSGKAFGNLPVSAQDESRLSPALNPSTSKNTPLMKVIVSKNSLAVNKKYSQSVDAGEANTALGQLYFEKQLTENKQFLQNSETEKLPVKCTSFPNHTRMDDYRPAGHDDSTVDFKSNLKLVSENCNEEDSSTDEEVLLLD